MNQPLGWVCDYFGPDVAFYFMFAEFYLKALVVPSSV